MALHDLRTDDRYKAYAVSSLLTTLTEGYDRISGHGVRNSVLDRQVDCLGLDVHKTYIPRDSSMDDYDSVIEDALLQHKARGVKVAATGDIFVEKRRMSTLKNLGLRACCPLLR
jgi:diphthamide synthase (EF-2-diphthine--ammonia ligase)